MSLMKDDKNKIDACYGFSTFKPEWHLKVECEKPKWYWVLWEYVRLAIFPIFCLILAYYSPNEFYRTLFLIYTGGYLGILTVNKIL